MARTSRVTKTVRRSVALPIEVVEEAQRAAPLLRDNLNRLVIVALKEFVAHRRQLDFEAAMARMAADPKIRAESSRVAPEFAAAENDGL